MDDTNIQAFEAGFFIAANSQGERIQIKWLMARDAEGNSQCKMENGVGIEAMPTPFDAHRFTLANGEPIVYVSGQLPPL